MNETFELKSANLKFVEGSSAKGYKCEIAPNGTGWDVKFAYGRLGTSFTTGTKNPKPVSYRDAVKIFDKLVAEKTGKGYRHEGSLVTSIQTSDKVDTGIRPMLLNEVVDEAELERLLDDDRWDMQEKFDGRRLCIELNGDQSIACNRKGQQVPADLYIHHMRQMNPAPGLYDGEDMGDKFVIFDFQGENRDRGFVPWGNRVRSIWSKSDFGSIKFAPVYEQGDKRIAFNEIKARNGEGVVFRFSGGMYRAGRPNSGGDILKWKFKASITCSVIKVNDKRSVQLGLRKICNITGLPIFDFVGNVTIPANHDIPGIGDAVEVEYLYAYQGGSLYQPVYKGKRDDVPVDGFDKLKFKPEEETEL